MSRSAIFARPADRRGALDGAPRPSIRPIQLGTPRAADFQQRKHTFLRHCEEIAWLLATASPEERLAIYSSGAISYHDLSIAAGLRPDLMPIVNGEWEWIALSLADLD